MMFFVTFVTLLAKKENILYEFTFFVLQFAFIEKKVNPHNVVVSKNSDESDEKVTKGSKIGGVYFVTLQKTVTKV